MEEAESTNKCPERKLHDSGLQILHSADDTASNWLKGTAMEALMSTRPYPSEITVLIQHTVTVHSSVIDAIFQLILHVDVVLCNCSNSRI